MSDTLYHVRITRRLYFAVPAASPQAAAQHAGDHRAFEVEDTETVVVPCPHPTPRATYPEVILCGCEEAQDFSPAAPGAQTFA